MSASGAAVPSGQCAPRVRIAANDSTSVAESKDGAAPVLPLYDPRQGAKDLERASADWAAAHPPGTPLPVVSGLRSLGRGLDALTGGWANRTGQAMVDTGQAVVHGVDDAVRNSKPAVERRAMQARISADRQAAGRPAPTFGPLGQVLPDAASAPVPAPPATAATQPNAPAQASASHIDLRRPAGPPSSAPGPLQAAAADGPSVTFGPRVIPEMERSALLSPTAYRQAIAAADQAAGTRPATFAPDVRQSLATNRPLERTVEPPAFALADQSPAAEAAYQRQLIAAGGDVSVGRRGRPRYTMPDNQPVTAADLGRQVGEVSGGKRLEPLTDAQIARVTAPGFKTSGAGTGGAAALQGAAGQGGLALLQAVRNVPREQWAGLPAGVQ